MFLAKNVLLRVVFDMVAGSAEMCHFKDKRQLLASHIADFHPYSNKWGRSFTCC